MQWKTPRFEQKLVFRGACPARSTLHHHHISKTSSVWVMRQLCAIYFTSLLFFGSAPLYVYIYLTRGKTLKWTKGNRFLSDYKSLQVYSILFFFYLPNNRTTYTHFSLSVSFGLGLQSSSSSPRSVMLYIIKFFVSAFLSMQIDCIVSTLAHVSTFTISHTLSSDLGAMQRSSGLSISDLRVSFFSFCLSSLLHFFAPCE